MAAALREWETFWVIIGSSAAALTGLQFVVIALISEAGPIGGGEEEMQTFGTPTVVHFSFVLLIAAFCSIPHQSAASLAWCLVISAIAAVAYMSWITAKARRVTGYKPVLEDWLFHAILPLIAYGALLIAGIMTNLYIIGAAALLLLYIGIHNAWDTAMFISMNKRAEQRAAKRGEDSPPQ
jgi:hypothetical protein